MRLRQRTPRSLDARPEPAFSRMRLQRAPLSLDAGPACPVSRTRKESAMLPGLHRRSMFLLLVLPLAFAWGGGRAAAYEAKGDYDRALADRNTVVLLYGVELEILKELEAPGRDQLVAELAQAYRARGETSKSAGRLAAAQADRSRADKLEADAR